jgi:hypothetical protein
MLVVSFLFICFFWVFLFFFCFFVFNFFCLFDFVFVFLFFVFCDWLGNSHLTWGLCSYIAFYINPRRYIVKKNNRRERLKKNNLILHFLARNVGIILTKIPIFHQVK